MSPINQSTAFSNLSPVTALTPTTDQWWVVILSSSRICWGGEAFRKMVFSVKMTLNSRLWSLALTKHLEDLAYSLKLTTLHQRVVLQAAERSFLHDKHPIAFDQPSQRPTRVRLCFRSSFSSTTVVTSDLQRPTNSACSLKTWNCEKSLKRGGDSSLILPLCSKVLILNPRVGEIVSMGSPLNRLRIVVLPALSRPLRK